MKKRIRLIIVTMIICINLFLVANATPTYSYFCKNLTGKNLIGNSFAATEISRATSSTAISGTRINATAENYATFRVLQYADLGNGKVQVSPKISVSDNVTTWLGFYNGYSSVRNKYIYLYAEAQSAILDDTIRSGYWYR